MFYSQFILAKKGPLGTIWIAAHLERKLRKNQVADTDIGVSVDSILFPEVPIALRLSSHLLLGVVRIYSRKVNYLFHDCSEALLKIKQAFRSTAVDLPPEESTAPYHSITLPETFDLDDFELPDAALLNGNFVDHHVSTREQITLQDTMDASGYLTSQFGLDERFGDGDVSQISLDLDEELFLDKNLSPPRASVSLPLEEGAAHQVELSSHLTTTDIDEGQYAYDENKNAETAENLSEILCNSRASHVLSTVEDLARNDDSSHRHLFNIQTPDLNEVFLPDDPSAMRNCIAIDSTGDEPPSPEFIESAHGPSTPGLLEESIPANVQEIPSLSSLGKILPSTNVEPNKHEISASPHLDFECPDATQSNGPIHAISTGPKSSNVVLVVSSPTSVLSESKPDDSVAPQCSGGVSAAPNVANDSGITQSVSMDLRPENNASVVPSSTVLAGPHSLAQQSSGGILAAPGATKNGLIDEVAKGPKYLDHGQLVSFSSLALTEPIHGSLAPESSDDILAARNVSSLESLPKSIDNLPNGYTCNEANNLPISDQMNDKVKTILPEVALSDGLVSSSCSHEASNFRTPLAMSVTNGEVAVVTSNISTDSILVSGLASDINSNSLVDKTELSNLGNMSRVDDANSCLTSNISAHISDFENASGFLSREPSSTLETPRREEQQQFSGSSVKVQGVNKPEELSKDTQLDHLNCFSSSEFPEPEQMLFASTLDVNLPNDLGQQTAEKGVTESDGSVDRLSNLRGQKRRLMDSLPALQDGISTKISGIPRSRRNTEYIPDDDDLLASILVGRRTPALRIGATPLPKTASLKRTRLMTRVGLPKRRKVLLDDTMVLHADAIRQQLINTEDIRRLRKKAPCTRPEIWRIQKSLIEDDIFNEATFAGIAAELNSLHTRRYDLNGNPGSQITEHHLIVRTSSGVDVSRSFGFVRETDGNEMVEQIAEMPDKVAGGVQGPSGTSMVVEAQNQLESPLPPQLEPSSNNQTYRTSTHEVNVHEGDYVELAMHSSLHFGCNLEHPTGSRIEETSLHEENRTDASPEKHDERCSHPEDQSLNKVAQISDELTGVYDETLLQIEDACNVMYVSNMDEDLTVGMVDAMQSKCSQDGHANEGKVESGETSVSMLDSFVLEAGACLPTDSSAVIGYTSSSNPDMATIHDQKALEETKAGDLEVAVEGEPVVGKVLADDERPTSGDICVERPLVATSPRQASAELENVPSTVGENSGMQEFNQYGGLDVESTCMDFAAARESSDFCSVIDGNDTEFLNVDDEADYNEGPDNEVLNPEEAQSLEYSGWSSRTRGVARYLKTMFDEESGHGRKVVAVDQLLGGKTRKEASRMFFETLVLKTRDYIDVEQENPFDYVQIKPRIKLLKSEF